ncbi:MAG: transglycosylase domain-containing protein [Paludibacter sp.]|nr:transglycosylase domain-containing protein [Paludibacter sp.]
MWNKIAIQLLIIWRFIKKLLTEYLPVAWERMKVWFKKFVAWRKSRFVRFRTLPWYHKLFNSFVTFIVLFLLYLFIVDINFLWLFGKSPGLSSISNPNQSTASIIYTSDGKVLGKYFRENRTPVTYNEISPILIKTLIATEDVRFYKHFGVDFEGVFAAIKDMTKGKSRGASTITQQLVKNMYKTRNQYSTGLFGYIPGVKLIISKTKEWTTAVKIEMFYNKKDILTMYLNTVDFGSNAFGIHTAAKTFFKTTPAKLNYEQSATLVGLLKATTSYSPIAHPVRSMERRNVVLDNLVKQKVISQQACDSLKLIPIQLNFSVEQNYDGDALHFRAYLEKYLQEWEQENGYDIYSDGLKIYVTIDSRMQKYAEEALNKQMHSIQKKFDDHWRGQNPWQDENHKDIVNFVEDIAKKTKAYASLSAKYKNHPDSITYFLNKPHKTKVFDYDKGEKEMNISIMDSIRYMNRFMHSSFVAMEPETGNVKAWVGDINFKFWQYDKVAQSKRQPGSTFKLFVYTAAMMHGMSPCDMMTDKPVTWKYKEGSNDKAWSPRNANGYCLGYPVSLKNAFAQSINTIAVQVAQIVGIPEIIKYAHLLGIQTPLENKPSTCLGSSDVSLLEMVNSFGTVVNEGVYHEPIMITRIEDKEGTVVYEKKSVEKRVIPYEDAWLMTVMLRGGMTEPGGTSKALWSWDLFHYNTDFGGKTGTSSNHSDAWFIGVTPKLVGGAWVGGEQRSVHFRTGELGQGSRTALPIFGMFMEKVLKDESLKQYRGKFPTKPKEEISREYSCVTHLRVDTLANDSAVMDESDSPEGLTLPDELTPNE